MISAIKQDAQTRMGKSIDSLKNDLGKLRTGRAHPGILDQVMVSYYGSNVPISQVANISVADSRMLTVTPWEKGVSQDIEKAIRNSDLGLNPASAGDVIRVPLPALTEETRRDMIKLVKSEGEAARVAIRNIRRDANHEFKNLLKDKEITEDDERRAQDDTQKLTDKYIAEADKLLELKEKDLMEI